MVLGCVVRAWLSVIRLTMDCSIRRERNIAVCCFLGPGVLHLVLKAISAHTPHLPCAAHVQPISSHWGAPCTALHCGVSPWLPFQLAYYFDAALTLMETTPTHHTSTTNWHKASLLSAVGSPCTFPQRCHPETRPKQFQLCSVLSGPMIQHCN